MRYPYRPLKVLQVDTAMFCDQLVDLGPSDDFINSGRTNHYAREYWETIVRNFLGKVSFVQM